METNDCLVKKSTGIGATVAVSPYNIEVTVHNHRYNTMQKIIIQNQTDEVSLYNIENDHAKARAQE